MKTKSHLRAVGAVPLLLVALAAGGWGYYRTPSAPPERTVLLGRIGGVPDRMMLPMVCWSRSSGLFETGAACDDIVQVGAVIQARSSHSQDPVLAREAWTCKYQSSADYRRVALRFEWPKRPVKIHEPAAWPQAVDRTIVVPTLRDWDLGQEEEARKPRAAQMVAAVFPPAAGWEFDGETDFDVDGDGRPERFFRARHPVGSGQSNGCRSGETALAVSWGGKWDPRFGGHLFAEGGDPPFLLDRQPDAPMWIVAAVDLDGDGRRELLVGGWLGEGACGPFRGRWALFRMEPTHAAVLARWDECGRSMGPTAPVGRDVR